MIYEVKVTQQARLDLKMIKEPWQSRNLRIMPVNNYLVFYIVENENRTATVIRIIYSARNIERELDCTPWKNE